MRQIWGPALHLPSLPAKPAYQVCCPAYCKVRGSLFAPQPARSRPNGDMMIETLIRFALSNFTLTLLIVGLIASAIAYAAKPRPRTRAQLVEALISYFLLFSVGVAYFYNFVMHVFFGEMAARFIGWATARSRLSWVPRAWVSQQSGSWPFAVTAACASRPWSESRSFSSARRGSIFIR